MTSFTFYNYETYTQPIWAGLADFDAATVNSALFTESYLQFLLFSQVAPIFYEPKWTFPMDSAVTQNCSTGELTCVSYLFVGGMDAMTPYPNRKNLHFPNKTETPEADSLVVFGERGLQIDFWDLNSSEESFSISNCQTWATQSESHAILLCIQASSIDSNDLIACNAFAGYSLIVAISVCPVTLSSQLQCLKDQSLVSNDISTTLALWTRTAKTVYSRVSEDLKTATDFSRPASQIVRPRDLLYTFNATIGPTNSSAADNSIVFLNSIFNQFNASGGDIAGAEGCLRQLLTFPLVWFQPNAFANPTADVPNPPLPSSLNVTAAFATSASRNIITPRTAIIYTCLAVGMFLWCVISSLVWGRTSPETSAFPLIDFAKATSCVEPDPTGWILDLAEIKESALCWKKLQLVRLYKRSVAHENTAPSGASA